MTVKNITTGPTPESGSFGHPRPQLQREWTSLNGTWDFALDADAKWSRPSHVQWNTRIEVPFAPETPRSGVNASGYFKACWYKRAFLRPDVRKSDRVVLHFGAVDYSATVWVNGHFVAEHEGGYTPFTCDVTQYMRGKGPHTVVVRAYDDPLDMEKPRGKQEWKRDPHGIWYPRTSGIWQTVWLEVVPATAIETVRWSSSVRDWCLHLDAGIAGVNADAHKLRVTVSHHGVELASDTYSVRSNGVERQICLPDPGIGDARNELTWHPDRPNLLDVTLEVLDKRGRVVDEVASYAALREIAWEGNELTVNGDTIRLRMALDQGYWPESGMTGDNAQQKRDVELAKEAGLNGVRKHQKVEDPRYLYWADRLGLLVWEEMPSAYAFSATSMRRTTAQWMDVLKRDFSHPCVMAYVPINESWMVPDLPLSEEQRNFVRALFFLTKAFDSTRPVVCNSGWEAVVDADIITVHDYDSNPDSFRARYADLSRLFGGLRPGGKQLLLDDADWADKVLGIDEFGGIKFDIDKKEGEQSWGYSEVHSAEEFEQKYGALVRVIAHHGRIAIWCWTQLTDTYQEKNGIYTMDRRPKANIERIRHLSWGWN